MAEYHIRGGEKAVEDEIKRLAAQRETADKIGKAVHELVERGRDYAEQISPVSDDPRTAGDFKASWEVKDYEPRREGDSPMSQLRNDSEGAEFIEYGTHRTPPHAVMQSVRTYLERIGSEQDIHI